MKLSFLILLFFLFLNSFFSGNSIETETSYPPKEKVLSALQYCKEHQFNTSFCVFIDMHIHSGKNRLYIYDFKNDSILNKGLCSHGCGDDVWGEDNTKTSPIFSNTPDSHCSSLGKFKIGKRGYSQWGIHVNYKLHGLETSNKNAYKRIIVLHSWEMMSNTEVYPSGSPEGWGCPAVSNEMMKILDKKLKASTKPVLMWVYN